MPSLVDATVVIQMIHVVCAYWILSTIFLRPAFELVMKINRERALLKRASDDLQHALMIERQEKAAELTHLQEALVRAGFQEPAATHERPPEHVRVTFEPLSPQQRHTLVKELASQLTQRIVHER